MQVILLERIEKLGQMGDVVTVKPGFARNFLLPKGKARRATDTNLKLFEEQRAQLEAQNLERRTEAEAVGEKLDGMTVVVIRAASEGGQLYGSVNARDIADAVTEGGVTIERNQVQIDRPIKTIGIFDQRIRLHPEVTVNVSVNVAQSVEEAEAQAERAARGEEAVVTAAELNARELAEDARRQAKEIAAAAGISDEDGPPAHAEEMFEPEVLEAAQSDDDAEGDTTSDGEEKPAT